ncbi:hypothetical protein, partial [Muribaculum intestinale]
NALEQAYSKLTIVMKHPLIPDPSSEHDINATEDTKARAKRDFVFIIQTLKIRIFSLYRL